MNEFKIEKNVPIPERFGRCKRYPFEKMEVGDSFLAPLDQIESARQSSYYWARKHGRKYKTQRQENGFRIWRIE